MSTATEQKQEQTNTKIIPFEKSEVSGLTNKLRRERCQSAASTSKEFLLNAPQKIDTERLKFLLETYREFDYEPVIVLRAQLFKKLLQNKTIFIDQNSLVGTVTGQPAGVYVYPEWDAKWIRDDLQQAMMSHLGSVNITDEEKKLMLEASKFFKNRCATSKAHGLSKLLNNFDPTIGIKAGVFYDGTTATVGAGNVDYATFINKGVAQIIRETEERMRAIPVTAENSSKIDFYRGTLICLKALIHLANRYAALAEQMAVQEKDLLRKEELLEIADVCRRVPEHPPSNFRESLQSFWFLHIGIQMEQAGCGSSPGRLGQYLSQYFQKDKQENGLTNEDALAWIKCLYVKILEYGYYQGIAYAELVSGHTGHTISVGGLTADGKDATTELDYLLLDAQIDMRNIQPTLTVLFHDGLKEDFLLKAIELNRTGLGQPQWLNNRVIMERLLTRHGSCGITLEEARNCVNMSCVGTGVAGKTAFIRELATFNLAKLVELTMNDGFDPITGRQVGCTTGDPVNFSTFEDFFSAFSSQIRHMFEQTRPYGSIASKVLGDTVPSPFRSAMLGGCLESGKHEYAGGPKYYLYYTISTAGVDAANALAAIKHLVYDTKQVSMQGLKEALAANFEGHETLLQRCLNAPKHGNDDEEMDALVRRVYDTSMQLFHKSGDSYFGKHIANLEAYSLSIHNYFGMLTGAMPSGRKKGRPLTDGSVSATPGTDKKGPLALVSSAAKALDTMKYGSNHFNVKLHPSALAGISGARNLITLIKSYMDMGGSHIQFNVVTSDKLKAAQETPEDYKDLTVRVAGFSAYFTRLHKSLQDEIVARTEHMM